MAKRVLDGLILSAAMLYILMGVSITPVHGDELTQIFMARDSYYMARGDWRILPYTVLGTMDQQLYLRLINGTVNKTLIGFEWLVQHRPIWDLPGQYDWTQSLDFNRIRGNVPDHADIVLSRWPSALFTALAVLPLFVLMRQLRCSRPMAYFAVLLYTLHPAVLLNGRRAVMEGSLMFGSIATICWLVLVIKVEQIDAPQNILSRIPLWLRYSLLGLLAGFTVAAKFSGVFVAATVVIAIVVSSLLHNQARRLVLCLSITLVSMAAIWFALNPAYWNDPAATFGVMLRERAFLLASQTKSSPMRYTNIWQRLDAAFTEPFLAQPQYYELQGWQNQIGDQIVAYQRSPWAGWNAGIVGNIILSMLGAIGLGAMVYWSRNMQPTAWVILAWTGLTLVETLDIPLGWQRYYLPLILVAIVLSAIGGERVLSAVRWWQASRVTVPLDERAVQETFESPTA